MSLHKPYRQKLGNITDYDNLQFTPRFGKINDLSFTLPVYIIKNHKKVKNPVLNQIKERYIVKFSTYEFKPEYYVITAISKSSSDTDTYEISCKLTPHSLIWRKMRNYKVTSKSLKEVATEIFKNTGFSVGDISPTVQLKVRTFDEASVTKLDFLFKVCETFEVVPQFDTQLNKIHFYKEEELSEYKGFINQDSKFMTSISDQIDVDQLVTRLIVTGKDGVTINSVNPTGQNFIDDFSFYLYPFQRDENKNVIQSSNYMTDALANAILDYNEKVNKTGTEYKQLLDLLTAKQKEQQVAETDLFNKNLEKVKALDYLETRKSIAGADLAAVKKDADVKIKAYDDQKKKIDGIKSEVTEIQDKIGILKEKLKLENNLSPSLLAELEQNFIHEEEWTNDNIFDESELYEAGMEQMAEMNTPPVNVTTSIINFFEVTKEKKNWNRLALGDIIRTRHKQLGIDIKAKVIEMSFNFSDSSISITLSNQKRKQTDAERVISALYAVEKAKTEYNAKKANYEYTHQNFTLRNDRIGTTPADPTLPSTPISHTENDNGSVDLTFNWEFPTDDKDEHNIDGFQLFLYPSKLSDPYVFGATNAKETEINVNNPVARSYTFSGIPSNLYYSIAVQAYRRVDTDVNVNGIVLSEKISNKTPYRPKASVEVKGNVEGKLNNININFSEEDPIVDGEANVKITPEGGFEVYDFEQQKYVSKYDKATKDIEDALEDALEDTKENIDKIKEDLQAISDEDTLIRDNLEDFKIDYDQKYEDMLNLQKELENKAQLLEEKALALEEKAAGMTKEIAEKAGLDYVNGELIAKVDLSKYEEEYNAIRDDLLEKVDIEKYRQEYNDIVESLIGKADGSEVDSKLAELNKSLATSLQEVEDAKTNISTIRQNVADVQAEILANKDAIAEHGGKLTTITTDLNEVKGSFDLQAQTLTDLDGKLSKAQADITLNSEEIASRVKQLDFDELGSKVSSQETAIQQQATAIGLKANATDVYKKSEVDTELGKKVDTTTYNNKMSSIDLTVDGINQKVTNQETVLNELDDTVLSHSAQISEIDQKADSISLKVSETEADLEGVKDSVNAANAEIKLNKDAIALKAEKTEMDDLGERLTTTEGSLTVMNDAIASKVGQQELDNVTGRLTTAESTIEQTSTAIKSKVEQKDFDLLNGKVTDQSAQINTLADQINLQVSRDEFDDMSNKVSSQGTQINLNKDAIQQKADKTTLDTVTGRLEVAEANMIANADAIEQRVTKTEFDKFEIGGRNQLSDSRLVIPYTNNGTEYPIFREEMTEGIYKFIRVSRNDPTINPTILSLYTTIPTAQFNYDELVGKKVTVSFKVRSSHNTKTSLFIGISNPNKLIADRDTYYDITTDWTVLSYTIDRFPIIESGGVFRLSPYRIDIPEDATGSYYLDLREFKMELGDKATDWTQSQEDTNEDISNLDNRMAKAETSITQTANDITFKADKSTTYTKSEVEGKLNEVNLKISDANTLITQNTKAINLKANSQDVYTRTQADNLLGGKAGKGEFDALVTQVRRNESELAVQSDEIAARVTRDEYENLEFGGRNLILQTSDQYESKKIGEWYTSFGVKKSLESLGLSPGDYVTLSMWIKNPESSTGSLYPRFTMYKPDGTYYSYSGGTVVQAGEEKYTAYSHQIPDDVIEILFCVQRSDFGTGVPQLEFQVKSVMGEKGNRPTAWRPAPEDQIAYVDSSLSPVKERVSQSEASLKIQADRIDQLVSKTDSNAGRITKAESRISQTEKDIELRATKTEVSNKVDQGVYNKFVSDTNASLKVANDAISSKVSSTQLTTGINEAIKTIGDWTKSYTVKTSDPKVLRNIDDSVLSDAYSYEVQARTYGTGTESTAIAVFESNGDGKGWTLTKLYEMGTSSNHPEFFMNGEYPSIRLYNHTSYYNVEVKTSAYRGRKTPNSSLSSRIKDAESSITQQADQIKLKVSSSELTAGVNEAKSYADKYGFRGYATSHTGSLYGGQWTKIFKLKVTSRYQQSSVNFSFNAGDDGGSNSRFGTGFARLKQQTAMGDAPIVSLEIREATGVSEGDFVYVVTQNTSKITEVTVWMRVNTSHDRYWIKPIMISGSYEPEFLTEQGFSNPVPGKFVWATRNMTANDTKNVNGVAANQITTRLTKAESSITQHANEIKLKVSQTELNKVTSRVSAAESSITQHASQINLRVEKNNVLSAINLTPEKIKISTDRLLIGDYSNYASWENKGDQNTSPWRDGAKVDTTVYKSSNSSFRIPPNTIGIGLKREIPVQGGEKIYYSFWIKTASNWNGRADNSKLRFGDQNGTHLLSIAYNGVKTNWTFKEGVYTVPSTGVTSLKISIGNDGSTGNVWLDDITITKQYSAVKIEDGAIRARHLSVEGIDAKYITSGTLDAGRIKVQGGSGNEYAKIDGAILQTRGQYSRTWFGKTETLDSEITVGGGMVRVTKVNDPRGRRNLYYTNNGISTTAVGADNDEGTGSGVIEFFSHVFDTERRGLTLYSNLGTIGLKTDSRDIILDSARDTVIMASTGRVILRPKDDNRVGNNHFSFTVKLNSSSSDTDGVLQYGSPATNFGSSLRFGKSSVDPTVWVTNGNGDFNTGSLVAKDVTATRDLIGNVRSSGTNIYMMGDGEVRVVDSKGYNGGNMRYRPVRAGSFPTGSSIKYKSNLEKFDTNASELVKSQQVWTYHLQSNLDKLVFDKPKVGFINEMVSPLMRDEDGVDPYSIVSILWKSSQELIDQVSELNKEVETLTLALDREIKRNNKLEAKLTNI